MLTGAVGCAFFVGSAAHADLFSKAPLATVAPGPAPAVDGFNEKFDVFGGSIANRTLYGTQGSLGVPLAGPYGVQIDGNLGSLSGSTYGAGAGHLFWRNPGKASLASMAASRNGISKAASGSRRSPAKARSIGGG